MCLWIKPGISPAVAPASRHFSENLGRRLRTKERFQVSTSTTSTPHGWLLHYESTLNRKVTLSVVNVLVLASVLVHVRGKGDAIFSYRLEIKLCVFRSPLLNQYILK